MEKQKPKRRQTPTKPVTRLAGTEIGESPQRQYRCSDPEFLLIREAAKRAGESVSAYLRRRALEPDSPKNSENRC